MTSRDVRMTRRWSTATCTHHCIIPFPRHPKPKPQPQTQTFFTHTHTHRVAMPVLVAAAVSGGFAIFSHFSISTDNAPQNALPPSSIHFTNCWTKRPALLSPAKVSLSNGSTTQTDDVQLDQSSLTDDFKLARVCVFLFFSILANDYGWKLKWVNCIFLGLKFFTSFSSRRGLGYISWSIQSKLYELGFINDHKLRVTTS